VSDTPRKHVTNTQLVAVAAAIFNDATGEWWFDLSPENKRGWVDTVRRVLTDSGVRVDD
jgi:hypothetical protein